jgi:hypothetical protein
MLVGRMSAFTGSPNQLAISAAGGRFSVTSSALQYVNMDFYLWIVDSPTPRLG